jgi:hypothetical protein
VWCLAVGLPGTAAVPGTVVVHHYSHTITVCPHVLQALTELSARTSYRPMMALMSDT